MKITYPIRIEDFRALRPPLVLRAGQNAGFRALVIICALIFMLGLLLTQTAVEVGGFVMGLAAVAVVVAFMIEKRSLARTKEKYENSILAAYEQEHCRDARTFEADEEGFRASCQCGSVARPWSELVQFSESPTHFFLRTKLDAQAIPKSGFPAVSEVTEFRALADAKLNRDRPVLSPRLSYVCQRGDFRDARMLHIRKGGEWRIWLKRILLGGWAVGGFAYFCVTAPGNYVAAVAGPIIVLLAFHFSRTAGLRRKHPLVPLQIQFSADGLFLQDPATVVRAPWSQFIGYLEGERVLLLYYHPKLYRVIPKRALRGPGAAFLELVKAKLPKYDYRRQDKRPKAS